MRSPLGAVNRTDFYPNRLQRKCLLRRTKGVQHRFQPALAESGGFPPNLGGNTDNNVRPKSSFSAWGFLF